MIYLHKFFCTLKILLFWIDKIWDYFHLLLYLELLMQNNLDYYKFLYLLLDIH